MFICQYNLKTTLYLHFKSYITKIILSQKKIIPDMNKNKIKITNTVYIESSHNCASILNHKEISLVSTIVKLS